MTNLSKGWFLESVCLNILLLRLGKKDDAAVLWERWAYFMDMNFPPPQSL